MPAKLDSSDSVREIKRGVFVRGTDSRPGGGIFCACEVRMPETGLWQGSVLIVEDDPALRELYRWALRAAGFAVVAVSDGLEALRHLESAKPDAVVLDLNLPHVSGRDVQQELNASPETRHIPIIVVSGEETDQLNLDDFTCVLRKPISTDELVAAVRRCFERHGRG